MNIAMQTKQKSNGFEPLLKNENVARILLMLITIILVLMPFHGFLTTWAGSTFGNLLMWRAWKEILLVLAGVLGALLFIRDGDLRHDLLVKKRWLLPLLCLFISWQLVFTLFGGENQKAAVLGFAIHARWAVMCIVALIASYYIPPTRRDILKIILIPAAAVVMFGLLQMTILPHDFLKHFGYEKNVTIPPFFTIDEQLDQIRIASTLRGPNPLGVYLIIPITLIVASLQFVGGSRKKLLASCGLLLASLIVLFGSHSRGAWLGLLAALVTFFIVKLPQRLRLLAVISGIVLMSLGALGVYQYRNTDFIQDVVLHDNPKEGGEISSNDGHVNSLVAGITNIAQAPLLGCGVGCAGPASVHNVRGAQFSENYFLQTAEESGLIGLALLLAICAYAIYLLLQSSDDPLITALLTSFVGICVAAMTAHAWADDTIAYLWWGIMGLYLYNNKQGLKHGTKKTKTTPKTKTQS